MASKSSSQSTKKNKNVQSPIVKVYLILYNFIQTLGWTYLLYQIIAHYTFKTEVNKSLYETVKWSLFIFQNSAALEIFHAASGIVPSNVIITTFQVFSRVMVVCGVLLVAPTAQSSPGLPLCLLAWAITEIIRYLYYTLNLIDAVPYFLIWLRYTTFIILYPVGVTGELLCFYAAQKYVFDKKMWLLEMPNYLNATFSYHYLLLLVMALYIPLFPQMYLHMFAQRKKIIGEGTIKIKKK